MIGGCTAISPGGCASASARHLVDNDFRALVPRPPDPFSIVCKVVAVTAARRQAVRQSQQGRRHAGYDRALLAFSAHRDPGRADRRVTAPFGLDWTAPVSLSAA
jgi:hypothetical protein